MKTLGKALVIAVITITLSCCKRDDTPQTYEFSIPQEVKDYFIFSPGTYWIFENSNTHELDSVYVLESSNYFVTTVNTDLNREFKYEVLNLKTRSSYELTDFHYYSAPPIPENPSIYKPKINKIKSTSGDAIGETPVFFHPFNPNIKFYVNAKGDGYLQLEQILNSLEINGMTYNSVVVFINTYDITSNKKSMRYYYSKDIGIIKIENTTDSYSWNLIRHKIIR